jgi:hypothetical protein
MKQNRHGSEEASKPIKFRQTAEHFPANRQEPLVMKISENKDRARAPPTALGAYHPSCSKSKKELS